MPLRDCQLTDLSPTFEHGNGFAVFSTVKFRKARMNTYKNSEDTAFNLPWDPETGNDQYLGYVDISLTSPFHRKVV